MSDSDEDIQKIMDAARGDYPTGTTPSPELLAQIKARVQKDREEFQAWQREAATWPKTDAYGREIKPAAGTDSERGTGLQPVEPPASPSQP